MTPPSPQSLVDPPVLNLLSGKTTPKDTGEALPPSGTQSQKSALLAENDSISDPLPAANTPGEENVRAQISKNRSLSTDNRGIYEGAGELHPWEDSIDPSIPRLHYEEDLCRVFLQVKRYTLLSLQVIYLMSKCSD